jgi:DNA-binding IclR family transcriptional regulator
MLLTRMPAEAVVKLVRKFNADAAENERVDPDELLAQLADDRKRGYAVSMNQVTPHATLIAMLLPAGPAERPLAIGVAGLTDRLIANEARYVETMRSHIASMAAASPA